ncbi:hypothetical protein RI054_02g12580 [Pseudoscourfieldia marina]
MRSRSPPPSIATAEDLEELGGTNPMTTQTPVAFRRPLATLISVLLLMAAAVTVYHIAVAAKSARQAPVVLALPNPAQPLQTTGEAATGDEDKAAARSVLARQATQNGDGPHHERCADIDTQPWTPLRLRLEPAEPWCEDSLPGDSALWLAQGLAYLGGYHSVAAYDSFAACTYLAPTCFLCHLGEALAFGSTINDASTPAMRVLGQRAAARAKQAAAAMTDSRARTAVLLADAAVARFQETSERDNAYAELMDHAVAEAGESADVLSLAAEAHMLLTPWRFYQHGNGSYAPYRLPDAAKPSTRRALEYVERALSSNAEHPMALHLHIHLLEPTNAVSRAERSADALAHVARTALNGAVDHLTHMPSHIYLHINRAADAARANEVALADAAQGSLMHCAYGYKLSHDAHFAAVAHAWIGNWELARDYAEKAVGQEKPHTRGCLRASLAARFGHWEIAEMAASQSEAEAHQGPYDAAACALIRALSASSRRDADGARVASRQALSFCSRVHARMNDRAASLCDAIRRAAEAAVAFSTGDSAGGHQALANAHDAVTQVRYIEPPLWVLPTDDPSWPKRVGIGEINQRIL